MMCGIEASTSVQASTAFALPSFFYAASITQRFLDTESEFSHDDVQGIRQGPKIDSRVREQVHEAITLKTGELKLSSRMNTYILTEVRTYRRDSAC